MYLLINSYGLDATILYSYYLALPVAIALIGLTWIAGRQTRVVVSSAGVATA